MPLVNYGDAVSIPNTNRAVISTSVDVWDETGGNIGFISAMSRTDARQTTPIRHLDSSDAGRIVEQSPGPETNTLNITGYALYNVGNQKKGLIHRLVQDVASIFRSLNGQHIPFDITERFAHPQNADQETEYAYLGCWLTNFSHPVNIGTVSIAETANVTVSWVE